MSLRISVDCDVTFVRTDVLFLQYLEDVTGVYNHGINVDDLSQKVNYDITKYFKQELHKLGMTGFEFWDNPTLYDNLFPIEGSVSVLESLHNQGAEITFVSQVLGKHGQSKMDFLEFFCPFVQDVIFTAKKHIVPCDIIIEDRIQNLEWFTNNSIGLILDNKYISHQQFNCPYTVVDGWQEVENRVKWITNSYF